MYRIYDSDYAPYIPDEGVIDAFREIDDVGYIETDITKYDEDYDENLTKAYVPIYVVKEYSAELSDADVEECDNIDQALHYLEYRPEDANDHYEPHNDLYVQFKSVWIDKDGDIVYEDERGLTTEDIDDCPLIQEILGKYDDYIAMQTFSSFYDMRNDTQDELSEIFANEYNGREYDYEGHIVYLRAKSAFADKYTDIEVVDKETDEIVGYIECRFADHSYNPSNNYGKEGAFISVVVNSNDPTKNKFHGKYNLRYSDNPDVNDIMEDLDERIDEIMYDGSFLTSDGETFYGL